MQQKLLGSQKYRQLAHECRHLAQITGNCGWKERYLQLAKIYDKLAEETEGSAPPPRND